MQATEQYDYIVVGGGSAGCITAARLAEANIGTVLLLEAGDPAEHNPETLSADGFVQAFANDNVMLDRLSASQPRCANRHLYVGTGTGMGGSGAVNGMVYTRGDKLDFEQWPKGWRWKDVAPVFERIEDILRVKPRSGSEFTITCVDAAVQSGFTRKDLLNDGELCGHIGYQLMNYDGNKRRNSYVSFLQDKALPNLTIVTNTRVQRILFDEQQTAVAVEFKAPNGIRKVGIQREIVLCAGALETPKLLMLSGVGPKNQSRHFNIPLVADVPSIGRNLQDHPNVCVFYRGKRVPDSFYPQVYGFDRMNPQLLLPANQADTCFVFYSAAASIQQSMQRMLPAILLKPGAYAKRGLRNVVKQLVNTLFLVPFTKLFVSKVYGIVVILGKPLSRGEVTLASRDPAEPARVNPGYFLNSADMDTMVDGVLRAQKIASQGSFVRWGNTPLSKAARSQDRNAIKQWVKGAVMTTFHFAGSCRMGAQPADPVDTQLRVKALRNVRVADASVMP
ncbi:MAG TPA: GMC family oxidoreductase, partial [Dongiaceae bacterium]|nr:GMC family oxidoreductase [Dongiaceae bacterium]